MMLGQIVFLMDKTRKGFQVTKKCFIGAVVATTFKKASNVPVNNLFALYALNNLYAVAMSQKKLGPAKDFQEVIGALNEM